MQHQRGYLVWVNDDVSWCGTIGRALVHCLQAYVAGDDTVVRSLGRSVTAWWPTHPAHGPKA